jgi:hypothetical protein
MNAPQCRVTVKLSKLWGKGSECELTSWKKVQESWRCSLSGLTLPCPGPSLVSYGPSIVGMLRPEGHMVQGSLGLCSHDLPSVLQPQCWHTAIWAIQESRWSLYFKKLCELGLCLKPLPEHTPEARKLDPARSCSRKGEKGTVEPIRRVGVK